MKKFTIILMMLLVASIAFAGSMSVKTSLGYDLITDPGASFEHKSAIDVGFVYEMAPGYEANTYADVYVSGSFQTNLKDKFTGDVFCGAGFTAYLSDKVYNTFIFGFDTLWLDMPTCGPGLYVDFGIMCNEHFSFFAGTKVMHVVEKGDTVNDKTNVRVTLGGGYKF